MVLLFASLQPRIASVWRPGYKQQLFREMTSAFLNEQGTDYAELWRIRDLFAPGIMMYNDNYLYPNTILRIAKLDRPRSVLLHYHTPDISYQESLVTKKYAELLRSSNRRGSLAFQNDTIQVWPVGQDGELRFVAFLPIEEMKKINGMIDYTVANTLLQNNMWMVEMRVNVPEGSVVNFQ